MTAVVHEDKHCDDCGRLLCWGSAERWCQECRENYHDD